VVKVPLTADYRHDVAAMLKAQPAAASSISAIRTIHGDHHAEGPDPRPHRQAPANAILLVDEAYFHYAGKPDYETVTR